MAGRSTRRTRSGSLSLIALAALAVGVLTGCSTASGDPSIAVPTFPAADPSRPAPGAAPIKIALPDDCARLMSVEQAGALFGQPLGAVNVKTVRGVPEPAVKRTERVACTYRATGQGDTGPVLYQLNIGRYSDAAAASAQWRSNTNAERSGAMSSKDLTVAGAPAVFVEQADESTLAVSYGVDTLTFVLPKAAPGQNRSAAETLPDLAQRVIPALAPTQPPGSRPAAPAAPPAQPSATPAAAEGRP
ncbi:hypothetical protein [Pseudonocardia endophytica]|uniref:DUF3558 domain-containing protein n=1 Tax=Pseudonocardia endophytica TaxID=401976 RepID=A0A4R1I410_PSEEN|nr:hypothetical protein [Pseudonocardia endophytica]TCK24752.1 hypothetical protein EV378_0543 [Pseudonocardia endophytica]